MSKITTVAGKPVPSSPYLSNEEFDMLLDQLDGREFTPIQWAVFESRRENPQEVSPCFVNMLQNRLVELETKVAKLEDKTG